MAEKTSRWDIPGKKILIWLLAVYVIISVIASHHDLSYTTSTSARSAQKAIPSVAEVQGSELETGTFQMTLYPGLPVSIDVEDDFGGEYRIYPIKIQSNDVGYTIRYHDGEGVCFDKKYFAPRNGRTAEQTEEAKRTPGKRKTSFCTLELDVNASPCDVRYTLTKR